MRISIFFLLFCSLFARAESPMMVKYLSNTALNDE